MNCSGKCSEMRNKDCFASYKQCPRTSKICNLNMCKEYLLSLPENLQRKVYQTAEIIIKHPEELNMLLPGEIIDIDSLQLAFQLSGYEKGNVGDGTHWYKNIISNASGYIAELEAVSADKTVVRAVVNSIPGDPMIEAVEIQRGNPKMLNFKGVDTNTSA